VGLLVVLAVVAGLYVEHALNLWQTHSQAETQSAIVHRLISENAALVKEEQTLGDPATIVQDARELGMVRPGERPYAITGVPSH